MALYNTKVKGGITVKPWKVTIDCIGGINFYDKVGGGISEVESTPLHYVFTTDEIIQNVTKYTEKTINVSYTASRMNTCTARIKSFSISSKQEE